MNYPENEKISRGGPMEAHRYGRSMHRRPAPSPGITIPRSAGCKSQFASLTLLKPEKNFFLFFFFFFSCKTLCNLLSSCTDTEVAFKKPSHPAHPAELPCFTRNWSQSISEASSPSPFNKSVNNRCTAPPTFPTAPVPNLLSLSLPAVGSHRLERRESGWKWRKQESAGGRGIGATGKGGCAGEPGGEGRGGTREQGREDRRTRGRGKTEGARKGKRKGWLSGSRRPRRGTTGSRGHGAAAVNSHRLLARGQSHARRRPHVRTPPLHPSLLFLCSGARPVPSGGTARRCRRVASPTRSAGTTAMFCRNTMAGAGSAAAGSPLSRAPRRPLPPGGGTQEGRGRSHTAHTPAWNGHSAAMQPSSLPTLRNKVQPGFPHPFPAPLQSPARSAFTRHRCRPPSPSAPPAVIPAAAPPPEGKGSERAALRGAAGSGLREEASGEGPAGNTAASALPPLPPL